jgi:hypothetical protein
MSTFHPVRSRNPVQKAPIVQRPFPQTFHLGRTFAQTTSRSMQPMCLGPSSLPASVGATELSNCKPLAHVGLFHRCRLMQPPKCWRCVGTEAGKDHSVAETSCYFFLGGVNCRRGCLIRVLFSRVIDFLNSAMSLSELSDTTYGHKRVCIAARQKTKVSSDTLLLDSRETQARSYSKKPTLSGYGQGQALPAILSG